jgi:hypothetical protein
MSKILKTYPFILNYKSIHINITDETEYINIELTSKHMIHTSYIPNTVKGNKMIAKINFNNTERLCSKENGVTMHLTLNSELGWFYSIIETKNGIEIEFNTSNSCFNFEQTFRDNNSYVLTAQLSTK